MMARILNAISIVVMLALASHFHEKHFWIFAACITVATTVIAVRLKRPIFGADLAAALLWFCAMEAVRVTFDLLFCGFAVPVFIASIALEAVRRRYAIGLFTPAAAVAVAAIVVGRHPFGLDIEAPYDNNMPVIGAIGALFVGQVILSYLKDERLLRLALPIAVVVVGWLVGSLMPLEPIKPLEAVQQLLGFFLPSFALPAVAAVAIIEAASKRQEGAASGKCC
jgi:hypothetical protein